MPLRRFLTAYYAYVFLIDFMLGYAIYAVWFEVSGLGVWEIALLFAIWAGIAAAFEVPSGALSDRFDRRWLLVAAPVIKAGTFLLWVFAESSFAWFALGFGMWSFAMALVSGSKEALLYEHLDAAGRADDYDRALGADRAAAELSVGLAILIGAIVGHFSLEATLWLTLPPLALSAIVACWLPDLRRGRSEGDAPRTGYFGHFANAFAEFKREPDLRFLTLYLMFGTVFGVIEEFDPLYFLALGLPIWSFGVIGGIVIGAKAWANLAAHRFAGFSPASWLFPLIGGIMLTLSGVGHSPWMLVPLVIAYLVTAPATILAEARFQSAVGDESRATTTSAMIFFYCVTGIAMCLAFGAIAELAGVIPAYGWSGVYLTGFAIWAWSRARRGQSATRALESRAEL
ncbi:MAG: MFS transporter [Sphingomonadaceae bacterium]|nr:MFS transporter [Sphingomonadaceae bacterium]